MRLRYLFLIFTVIIMLTSCQVADADNPDKPFPGAVLIGEKVVLFPEEKFDNKYIVYPEDGHWTPSAEDIIALEEKIVEYLQENAHLFEYEPWKSFDEYYYRQYAGYTYEGRYMIYGNYICGTSGFNWTRDMILGSDGGECFVQIKYDVENGTFTEIRVNGEA